MFLPVAPKAKISTHYVDAVGNTDGENKENR